MLRATLALLFLASGAVAQPRLAFESERHDFGTFTEGETVTHVFRFTNEGDAPLALTEVEASCGCTTPEWTQEAVAPGASGSVTVAYDSDARPGPFEKLVMVSASGAEPVALRIVGEVTSIFVADGVPMGGLTFATDRIDVGAVPSGEAVQEAVRFQHVGARPIKILSVQAPDGVDVVFPRRALYAGDVRAIMVTVETPEAFARDGALDLSLVVQTDDAEATDLTIRLTGTLD